MSKKSPELKRADIARKKAKAACTKAKANFFKMWNVCRRAKEKYKKIEMRLK